MDDLCAGLARCSHKFRFSFKGMTGDKMRTEKEIILEGKEFTNVRSNQR